MSEPKVEQKVGKYSCATCGMFMRLPCEHWVKTLEETAEQVERLKKALRITVDWCPNCIGTTYQDSCERCHPYRAALEPYRAALEALDE